MERFLVDFVASGLYVALVIVFSIRYPSIRWAIWIGGGGRLALAWLIGYRALEIQGTTSDARGFERLAGERALLPWGELLATFDFSNSYVISSVGGVLYKLIYPSPVMLNIVNAGFSVWLIVLSYLLAKRLFGEKRGRAAAWVISVFPYAVLYGSVFRREVFGSVFLMLSLLAAIKWDARYNPVYFILAMFYIFLAASFHGGFIAAGIGLLSFSVFRFLFFFRKLDARDRLNATLSSLAALLFAIVIITYVVISGIRLNNIGHLDDISVADSIEARVLHRVSDGGSSYPDFLRGVDPFSSPAVIPGRLIYFHFSPFPWDIRAPNHLLGFFATVLFLLIFRSIFRSRKQIMGTPKILMVAVMVFSCLFVFGVSIDNIGTSIRHRTKFVYALVALCGAPLLTRLRLRFGGLQRGSGSAANRTVRPGRPVFRR